MINKNDLVGSMAAGMMGRARRRIARKSMKATPKTQGPLTDKMLLEIQQEFTMTALPEEAWEWVAKHGEVVICEIKRLRAGQARDKILKDALDRAKIGNVRVREFLREPRKDNLMAFLLDEYEAILWALKQADAVKGIE